MVASDAIPCTRVIDADMREADPIHLRWVECNNEVGICGWSAAGADVAVGGVGGHGADVGMGGGGEEGEEEGEEERSHGRAHCEGGFDKA